MKPSLSVITHIHVLITQIVNDHSRLFVFPANIRTKKHAAHVSRVLVFTLFAGTLLVHATSIVIVRTGKLVVLAVDSRVIGYDAKTGKQNDLRLECKIEQANNVFVAAVGLYGNRKEFDVYGLAKDAALKGGNAATVANRFGKMVERPFADFLRSLRKEDVSECNHQSCLDVAFISFGDGTTQVSVRSLGADFKDGAIEPRVFSIDCPGSCDANRGIKMILGYKEAAAHLLEAQPDLFIKRGLISGVADLIGAEIAAHPNEVTAPIAILVLDEDGPRWAEGHQGKCPDIKQEKKPATRF